jgi:hypothetical protein
VTAVLRSPDGDYFEMEILGYEFPTIKNKTEDSNWLRVGISVDTMGRMWKAANPCLLTTELNCLVRWLRTVADKEPYPQELDFLEPCLSFCFKGPFEEQRSPDERVMLRIGFSHELRPPTPPTDDSFVDPVHLDIEVTRNDLLDFAEVLEQYGRQYPPRGKWAVPESR